MDATIACREFVPFHPRSAVYVRAKLRAMSSTPILDRIKPLPLPSEESAIPHPQKPRRRDIAVVLLVTLGTALWIVFMIASAYAVQVSQGLGKLFSRFMPLTVSGIPSVFRMIWYVGIAPLLALSYVVIVHECGHLLAGLCVRFRLLSIRFGPLEIRPPLKVSMSREQESGGPAGIVRMLPNTTTLLRLRIAIMVLAGPAANLACAIILSRFADEFAITAWFILFSYLMGIGNLVPFRGKGFDSDGRRLLMLSADGAQIRRYQALMNLASNLDQEVAPENYSREWLAIATAIQDDSAATMVAHYLAYTAAWYTSTIEEAGRLLEVALEHAQYASPVLRQSLICNAGVFQGRKHGRADLAGQWLTDLREEKDCTEHALHIEAAILEAKGDIPGALAKLDEAEKVGIALANEAKKRPSLRSLQRWRSELQTQPRAAAAKMVSS